MYGVFEIGDLLVISSGSQPDVSPWEHVSVSLRDRCPTWEEMCKIKDLFWGSHETVLQFHPSRDKYVNHHAFCLHLWKKIGENAELPPANHI